MDTPPNADPIASPAPRAGEVIHHGHLRERLPEVLVLTLGLLLSLAAAWVAQQWEAEQHAERVHDDVAVYAQALQQQLQSLVTAVQALAQFYNASNLVRADEFALFARPFLERNRAIRALEWVPLVQASERATFEAEVRMEGPADFAIREQSGVGLPPAAPRPAYFPVRRVEPLTGNTRALGFDLGSEPRRRAALERARDTGQAVATAPLTLVQETADQRAILVIAPGVQGGAVGVTPAEPGGRLQGFAVGAMRLGDLLEGVVAALPPRALDLVLLDPSLPEEAGLLHVARSQRRDREPASDQALIAQAPGDEMRLAVADRTLLLRALPVAGIYDRSRDWSWLLCGAGFVTSVALFALLRVRRRAAARLREREELFSLFMDHSPTVAWIKDAHGRWVYLSRTFEQSFGVGLHAQLGKTDFEVWPPDLAARFVADDRAVLDAGRPLTIEELVATADGQVRHWRTVKFPFRDADGRRFVGGIGMDVTERKEADRQLAEARREVELARVDVLTGIANRAGLAERLEPLLAQARRHGRRFAFVLLDLDGFKAINDTRGHLVGDQVLKDVAASLTRSCRAEDLVGRYGGDEFALVLADLVDAAGAVVVAERVRDAIAALHWEGCSVSASFGVALYPDDAGELLDLIHLADVAMYASKAAGKDRVTLVSNLAPAVPVAPAQGPACGD